MTARVLMWVYGVMAVANVLFRLLDIVIPFRVTKVLLIPVLLWWLLAFWREQRRDRPLATPLRWLAVALVFAWLGDVLLMPSGDLFFISGIGAFLVMQVLYIVAFTRVPGPGLVRAWKIALVPYVVVWIVVNVLVDPGALRIPVLIYSAILMTMAVVALDLVLRVPRPQGWRVAWGAVLFVVSDGLIALTAFGPVPSNTVTGALIMATYLAAQWMITSGFAEAVVMLDEDSTQPDRAATS